MATEGNIVDAYLILRSEGKNIPPNWIDRAKESRKSRQVKFAKPLREKSLDAIQSMKDWELAFKKECFYYGLRILMEIERTGKTKL